MISQYQTLYVKLHRWIVKNFGQGEIPQPKTLFNISFLFIVLLTGAMLILQVILNSGIGHLNAAGATAMLLGMVLFMLCNYFVLLNNQWMTALNSRLAILSRNNKNIWSVILLINVIAVCILSVAIGK
ncbi:hypothetical protein HH214_07915 [Mucilaginibacter robiniae]|uniref:Uncharacterized protein n=1 Tax=Mucilaginibacter robiniae TaxID=2728022 RepID=A0A7L5DXG8_9SPHI|nr:hypothetical protein [Mucilaginibacter robiniae]QJD95802.1 hypothetical protein HH214_07915 [Mucilaginibacter robiniae]